MNHWTAANERHNGNNGYSFRFSAFVFVGMAMDVEARGIATYRPAVIQGIQVLTGLVQEIPGMGDDHAGNVQAVDNVDQPLVFTEKGGRLEKSTTRD